MTSSFADETTEATTDYLVTMLTMLGNSTMTSRKLGRNRFVNCSGELYELKSARREEKEAIETFASVMLYVTLTLGVPGNILSALVWLRARIVRHNSSAVYLGALAIDDLLFLALYLLTRIFLKMLKTKHWPRIIFALLSSSRRAAEMLEPLLVTAFSVERLIAIIRPLQAVRTCCPSRAKKIVVILAVVALVVPVSQSLFDYFLYGALHRGVTPSRWLTIFVFFVLLPLATLIINLVVIQRVRRAARSAEVLTKHQTSQPNSAVPTAMLLIVSILYVALSSCSTLSYIVTRIVKVEVPNWCMKTLRPRWRLSDRVYAITSQIHKLLFAYNFVIYVITGRQFRAELRALFCRGGRGQTAGVTASPQIHSRDSAITVV